MGCHFLLQGIFPTQGLNPYLLYWQTDSLPLSFLGRLIDFLYTPIITIPYPSSTFVTICEPTLKHHNHPRFIVYVRLHSQDCTLHECRQIYNDMYPPLEYHTESFLCSKNTLCSAYSSRHLATALVSFYICTSHLLEFLVFLVWVSSHSVVSDSLQPQGLLCPWNVPGKDTGVDSHLPLQGIFPTQE